MRDISQKVNTLRTAKAAAIVKLSERTLIQLRQNKIPKGDPFPVAKVAAVQAAKNTSNLIPYCHPIPVEFVDCRFTIRKKEILIETEVKAVYKTGVEMEALAAACAAALTLYDMMKMIDESMEIAAVRLVNKTGGKSDFPTRENKGKVAVLVISDTVAGGKGKDESGAVIVGRLKNEGLEVVEYRTIPDTAEIIERTLKQFADKKKVDLVLTTGGTGLGPRDVTPEATARVIDREAQGISEIVRSYGQSRTPFSMLSRARAGLRGTTLIINLPGSPRGVAEALDILFPALHHSFRMIEGANHSRKKK